MGKVWQGLPSFTLFVLDEQTKQAQYSVASTVIRHEHGHKGGTATPALQLLSVV